MITAKTIPMLSIVEMLGIQHREPISGTVECKCPFCESRGYKLHVELTEGMFRCNRCGTNGGKLSLYTLVEFGRAYSKEMRDIVLPKLYSDLGQAENMINTAKYQTCAQTQITTPYTELSDADMGCRMEQIFNLKVLNLSEKDREKLLNRGLTEIAIRHNKYRTINYETIKNSLPDWFEVRCREEHWESIKNRNDVLRRISMDQFLAFMILGYQATEEGINLDGIPGAFSVSTPSGKMWGLRFYEGILIPIRNRDGLIVAAQVRTENARCKYMLLSSRGLQDGRTGKSRIHYPLANHESLRKDSHTMVITEGPLKADVYCCLASGHYHKAMALVGVNSTADLPDEIQSNSEIAKYYECFDADKLVNMAVMNGVRKIIEIIKKNQREVSSIYWDDKTAEHTLQNYLKYAEEHDLMVPDLSGNHFQMLGQLTSCLHDSGYTVPKELTHWTGKTKGIDDYLFSIS